MIGIYNVEHLARAMWADAEETFRSIEAGEGRTYRAMDWEQAHDLDRTEYTDRAKRVVRLCEAQAKDLLRARYLTHG